MQLDVDLLKKGQELLEALLNERTESQQNFIVSRSLM